MTIPDQSDDLAEKAHFYRALKMYKINASCDQLLFAYGRQLNNGKSIGKFLSIQTIERFSIARGPLTRRLCVCGLIGLRD